MPVFMFTEEMSSVLSAHIHCVALQLSDQTRGTKHKRYFKSSCFRGKYKMTQPIPKLHPRKLCYTA